MIIWHIKGIIIRITNPQRYRYLKYIRWDHHRLYMAKKKLISEIKNLLYENNIIKYRLISRIKTIGSIERKERYLKLLHKKDKHCDVIGIKIITQNKKECYKIMNILVKIYKLQKGEQLVNPEDFFKHQKFMRNTDSIAKNHIFVKIIFDTFPIHIIIMPKSDYVYIHQQRKKYLHFVYKSIKNK